MMKKERLFYIFTLLILGIWIFGLANYAMADTYVSGEISSDTTWTSEQSPYLVTHNIRIAPNVILTIEPGVTIKFKKQGSLRIEGTLVARGTPSNKIVFILAESESSQDKWGGISFADSSKDATFDKDKNYISGSVLENCIIEYAGTSLSAAITLYHARPFIKNCIIQNSSGGIKAQGINGEIIIEGCTIKDNQGIGIQGSGESATWIIKDNIITRNDGRGIYGQGSKWIITGNTISNNNGSGICGNRGIWRISSNTIRGNISNYGGGIWADEGMWTIYNNTISENTANYKGGGIYGNAERTWEIILINNTITENSAQVSGAIYADRGKWLIIHNTITGNSAHGTAAIYLHYVTNDSKVKYNTITNNESTGFYSAIGVTGNPTINYNTIHDNNVRYALFNDNYHRYNNLNATNNWWGTTDDSEIQEKIFDGADSLLKAIVDYKPFLTEPPAEPSPPEANFDANPTTGTAPLRVEFTDRASGEIYVWLWDFGDGNTSDVQNPPHAYLNPGTYSVTLTVIGAGGSDTKTTNISVQSLSGCDLDHLDLCTTEDECTQAGGYWCHGQCQATPCANQSPVIDSFDVDPLEGDAPLTVTFTCEAHDPDGNIASFKWDFDGDGYYDQITDSGSTTHTYDEAGVYHPKCTVVDNDGATVTSQGGEINVGQSEGGGEGGGEEEYCANENCPVDKSCLCFETLKCYGDNSCEETQTFNVGDHFRMKLCVNAEHATPSEKVDLYIAIIPSNTDFLFFLTWYPWDPVAVWKGGNISFNIAYRHNITPSSQCYILYDFDIPSGIAATYEAYALFNRAGHPLNFFSFQSNLAYTKFTIEE